MELGLFLFQWLQNLLEVKSNIFHMLKLCESLRAGMSPPADTGCPHGELRALKWFPSTDMQGSGWVPSASGSAASHQTGDVLHEEFHYI